MTASQKALAIGAIVVLLVWWTITACALTYEFWRPKVTQWGERTSPHQAAVLHVPERVMWEGVEYDCVLREKEGAPK